VAREAAEAGHTGSGRREDELGHPARRLVGELLGERAAERHAEDVDSRVTERVEERVHDAGESGHASRDGERRRTARSGHVNADRLDGEAVQGLLERFPHLDGRADAAQQQQRPSLPADAGPEANPARVDHLDPRRPGVAAWPARPGHVCST
jgi:hypothetical protein